jgi:hypothetical protein
MECHLVEVDEHCPELRVCLMIQVDFDFPAQNGYPAYRDALWIDENANLTESDLTTLKQARYSTWKSDVDAAVVNTTDYGDSDPPATPSAKPSPDPNPTPPPLIPPLK